MSRGGLRSTSFKPGVSGNPGGRPSRPQTIGARRIVADVKALARAIAPEAVETLKSVMLDTKAPPAARIGAATAILDRGYGKPNQTVDVTSILATLDLSKLSDEELEQLAALVSLAAGHAIDESIQSEVGRLIPCAGRCEIPPQSARRIESAC